MISRWHFYITLSTLFWLARIFLSAQCYVLRDKTTKTTLQLGKLVTNLKFPSTTSQNCPSTNFLNYEWLSNWQPELLTRCNNIRKIKWRQKLSRTIWSEKNGWLSADVEQISMFNHSNLICKISNYVWYIFMFWGIL